MLTKQSPKITRKNLATKKIALVVSRFNSEITESMYTKCVQALVKAGMKKKNIFTQYVPGALEIPLAAKRIIKSKKPHVVIALGCVIKGDTYHFELVANECARGCMQVMLETNTPIVFEVLATYNKKQAAKRAGDDGFNKGIEAALTALELV